MVEETRKEDKSLSGRDTTELTRDGELSILTKLKRMLLKDLMMNGASIATDHSTSDHFFQ
jgi:hypothetical protein